MISCHWTCQSHLPVVQESDEGDACFSTETDLLENSEDSESADKHNKKLLTRMTDQEPSRSGQDLFSESQSQDSMATSRLQPYNLQIAKWSLKYAND